MIDRNVFIGGVHDTRHSRSRRRRRDHGIASTVKVGSFEEA